MTGKVMEQNTEFVSEVNQITLCNNWLCAVVWNTLTIRFNIYNLKKKIVSQKVIILPEMWWRGGRLGCLQWDSRGTGQEACPFHRYPVQLSFDMTLLCSPRDQAYTQVLAFCAFQHRFPCMWGCRQESSRISLCMKLQLSCILKL